MHERTGILGRRKSRVLSGQSNLLLLGYFLDFLLFLLHGYSLFIHLRIHPIFSKTKYKNFTFSGIENVKDNNLRFDSDLLKNNNAYLIYPFNISTFSNEKGFISKSDIHHTIYYLDDDVKFEILKEAKVKLIEIKD